MAPLTSLSTGTFVLDTIPVDNTAMFTGISLPLHPINRTGTQTWSTLHERARLHAKYNITTPAAEHILSLISKRDEEATKGYSVETIEDFKANSFGFWLQVGGEYLQLIPDTGSADFWVLSSTIQDDRIWQHDTYNASDSPTYRAQPGRTWELRYRDDSGASGQVFKDDVNIGGLVVTGQDVQLAEKVTEQFIRYEFDGVFGLRFPELNSCSGGGPCSQWFQNAMADLPEKVFVVTYKQEREGSIDFGWIDEQKFIGQLEYAPIDEFGGRWMLPLSSATVKDYYNTTRDFPFADTDRAVVDTGTTLTYLPSHIVVEYYAKFPLARWDDDSAEYVVPCYDGAKAPDLELEFGHGDAAVRVTAKGEYLVTTLTNIDGWCSGGLQLQGEFSYGLLGTSFLRSVVAVFDVGQRRIGFAPQK